VAALIRRFGDPVRSFIEQRLVLVTSIAALFVVLGFVALRYVYTNLAQPGSPARFQSGWRWSGAEQRPKIS
jgi:hypothetical protein